MAEPTTKRLSVTFWYYLGLPSDKILDEELVVNINEVFELESTWNHHWGPYTTDLIAYWR